MSSEILSVLEYMEKEKGIPRVDMIATIANALKTAAQKGVNSGQELKIEINPKNGQLHAWSLLKVVDSVSNPKTEIHIERAQALKPGVTIGEMIEKELDPSTLGRIAAQTARLNAEVNAINVLTNRLTGSVNMVEALGGGWDASQLH